MESTFKLDWKKILSSKTMRSILVLGLTPALMYAFKISEDIAGAQAAQWIDIAFNLLFGVGTAATVAAGYSRVIAEGPLTKSAAQVQAERLTAAEKAAK